MWVISSVACIFCEFGMRSHVFVAGARVPSLPLPFGQVPALSDNVLLLLHEFLDHLLQIEAVNFGEMG